MKTFLIKTHKGSFIAKSDYAKDLITMPTKYVIEDITEIKEEDIVLFYLSTDPEFYKKGDKIK